MSGKVRFALVGAGSIAQTYAQAFEDCTWASLVAVADIREEPARALAERFGCPVYSSHETLAANSDQFDAVVICTPPSTHETVATCFLERRVHVLCEKPFAIDTASAMRMVDTAARMGVHLTMASKFRYVDDVVRARSIVASGALGEIISIENSFTSRVDMARRWHAEPAISGGGVLIDNGTHSVDIMRYLIGPLTDILVIEGKRLQGLPVEETVRVLVRNQAGVLGCIDLSWSLSKELDYFINIHGSQGTLVVGWKASRYRLASSPDWQVFGRGYDKVRAFRHQLNNFARAIRGEECLLITAEDALASVTVMDAGYASMRQTRWTPVRRRAEGACQHPSARAESAVVGASQP